MSASHDRFRKAAILVASLDSATAEALFASLPAEDAQRLRAAAEGFAEVDGEEQQVVLAEFLNERARGSDSLGVELDDGLARRLAGFEHLAVASAAPSGQVAGQPGGLAEIDAADLVLCLRAEHPQTIAVVLAQLPPLQAAEVLRHWEAPRRNELLERMAALSPTPPEFWREIEQELLARIHSRADEIASARRSEAQVEAILAVADEPVREAWRGRQPDPQATDGRLPDHAQPTGVTVNRQRNLDSDPSRDPVAAAIDATRAGPTLEWDELARLDDESLAALFAAAPAELVRLALAGADGNLVDRLRRHLGPRAARLLDRQLRRLDAVRLSDIQEAQRRLADLASRLVQEGVLS